MGTWSEAEVGAIGKKGSIALIERLIPPPRGRPGEGPIDSPFRVDTSIRSGCYQFWFEKQLKEGSENPRGHVIAS